MHAFIAVKDGINAIAVYQSIRPIKKGVAVLTSDPKLSYARSAASPEKFEAETKESETQDKNTDVEPEADEDNEHDEAEDEDEDEFFWSCNGVCVRSFHHFDNAVLCRMGCTSFCHD